MSVLLQHGRKTFPIHLNSRSPNDITLAEFKQLCSATCKIPEERLKLLHSGAVMKNDSSTLFDYGVREGSKVMLIAKNTSEANRKSSASTNHTHKEQATLAEIADIVRRTESELTPKLEEYTKKADCFVTRYLSTATTTTSSFPTLEEIESMRESLEYRSALKIVTDLRLWINETAMRGLLALDGVQFPAEFEEARQRRRDGVNTLQRYLSRVDSIHAGLLEAQNSGESNLLNIR